MADRAARRLLVAIGAGVLALAGTACDASSEADEPSAVTTAHAPSSTTGTEVDPMTASTVAPATTAATASSAVATAPPTTVDGAALLSSSLAAMSTTYHFTEVVTVDGAVALQADGDRVGDGVRLALAGNGGVVNYIITPDGSWVMPDGGEWEQLDSAAATSDPISALTAPTSVTVTAFDGTNATLVVTAPSTALGLAAGPDVSITCELASGVLHQLRFDSVVEGKAASVVADIGPVVDGSPVVAPV